MAQPEEPVEQTLDARYGRRAPRSTRRKAVLVVAGLVVLTATTLLVWAAFVRVQPGVEALTVSYDVRSDRAVAVRVEVTKPDGRAAECTVIAQDVDARIVGSGTVTAPAAGARAYVDTVLETTRLAILGKVESCRLLD
jgi:Domain of unknown function (DUF4307)